MKRYLTVGIIFGFVVIVIVVISWFGFPGWQNPASGGFWTLIAATVIGVLTVLQNVVSIWKDLKEEEQKPLISSPVQLIDSQKAESIYNVQGGTINVVQNSVEESKLANSHDTTSNLKEYLYVAIDNDSDFAKHEEYVIIENYYDDEEIQDIYAVLYSVEIVQFDDEKTQEKREKGDNEYNIQKGLKWKTSSGLQNHISLKPSQTGMLLLIRNTKFPDFLRFEIDELLEESHSMMLYYNEWYDDGRYKVIIDVYGRVGTETKYKKRRFAVFVDFKRNQSAEIDISIGM